MNTHAQQLNRIEEHLFFQGALGYSYAPSTYCTTRPTRTKRAGGGCFHVASSAGLCRRDYRSPSCEPLTGRCQGPAKVKRAQLRITPLALPKANELVTRLHRHHKKAHQHKFSIGLVNETTGSLVGVAICAMPRARHLDDGLTLEVARVATDGTPNACSKLLGACRRIAQTMGFNSIITFTLPSEGGASLRGAGWTDEGKAGGGSWNRPSRRRKDKAPTCIKTRWRATLTKRPQTINPREL